MEALTVKEQIKVLESIDWIELMEDGYGLCYGIKKSLFLTLHRSIPSWEVHNLIPLFKKQNAALFGARVSENNYWWPLTPYACEKRKEFINWIIEELKKKM